MNAEKPRVKVQLMDEFEKDINQWQGIYEPDEESSCPLSKSNAVQEPSEPGFGGNESPCN